MRDIDMDVAPGEVFVVMGLSGSGKSTLDPLPDAADRAHRRLGAHRRRRRHQGRQARRCSTCAATRCRWCSSTSACCRIARSSTTSPSVSRCAASTRPNAVARPTRRSSSSASSEMGSYRPHQLSGGQQQRVGLARALATDPDILLFDEPFSALDPLIRRDMQDEVVRLRREVNKTMVFITHDLSEALRLGDRIAIMRDGRFVQVGTPEAVVVEPADEYVENFVRDVPRSFVVPVEHVMRDVERRPVLRLCRPRHQGPRHRQLGRPIRAPGAGCRRRRTAGRLRRPGSRAVADRRRRRDDARRSPRCRRRPPPAAISRRTRTTAARCSASRRPRRRHLQGHAAPGRAVVARPACAAARSGRVPLDHAEHRPQLASLDAIKSIGSAIEWCVDRGAVAAARPALDRRRRARRS